MTQSRLLVLAAFASLAVGCLESADPGTKSGSESPPERSSSARKGSPNTEDEMEVGEADAPLERSKTPAAGDPGADPATTQPKELKAECPASSGGSRSITRLYYTIDKSKVVASKLEVEMTNEDGRDKNDIDLFITVPNGTEEKIFNSGDVLPNGKTTSLPIPSNFKPVVNASVRIETHWDARFSRDPRESCTLTIKAN